MKEYIASEMEEFSFKWENFCDMYRTKYNNEAYQRHSDKFFVKPENETLKAKSNALLEVRKNLDILQALYNKTGKIVFGGKYYEYLEEHASDLGLAIAKQIEEENAS